MTVALVLAGGGVAGIAWELGVLRGIADVDDQLAHRVIGADTVIGTSAGSTVAAQITSGTDLDDLYQSQLAPTSSEIEVQLNLDEFSTGFAAVVGSATDEGDRLRRIGAFALAADSVPEPVRRAAVAARLPVATWPDRDLRIPAVDATTGEVVIFTADSGVGLVDAVAASCAVPGVWPPVTIGTRRYVDGGVRSGSNADLARGADRVLILTPSLPDQPGLWGNLPAELAALGSARSYVVYADDASVAAFGSNPLSPSTRGPAARAGRDVGRSQVAAVRELLDSD
jgi:NTE family protein